MTPLHDLSRLGRAIEIAVCLIAWSAIALCVLTVAVHGADIVREVWAIAPTE